MIFEHRQVAMVGIAATFLVLLIAGVLVTSLGSRHHGRHPKADSPGISVSLSPPQPSGWTAVTPATAVPTDTPVQQQYDQALASGLASSSSVGAARVAPVPNPGFSSTWPALTPTDTPERWAQRFSEALLDIDFAHQPRSALGSWLAAEEAPELLPGVPAGVADKVLYLSLFDTTAVGGAATPIPDAGVWQSDARSGVRWYVSDVLVQPNPQFSQIVAAGWQPVDQRFAVEDVSGLLRVTSGGYETSKHFSMTVYVGSAHWHEGYGTVLVDNWQMN
jgi:hypothetical protein